MLVLGIDEAATHQVFLYVDEVKFYHTRHIAIVFLILRTVLGSQFQEHTRGQCHLVGALTLVTVTTGVLRRLIGIIGSTVCRSGTVAINIVATEFNVAGQVTEIVHKTVYSEIVAMSGITARIRIREACSCSYRMLLVEREFTHTIDGIVDVLAHLSHTVLRALEHHTRTKHTTEVSTLNSIQQTTCIDRAETVRLEIVLHLIGDSLVAQKIQILFLRQALIFLIFHAVDGHIVLTLIFQLEVSTLTVREPAVLIDGDGLLQAVIVGAIVGDVQLTVAVNHRKVSTTIDTTGMLGSNGDEVTVIDIVECSCGIAVDGCGIGIGLIIVRRHVTTGEYGIVDVDTAFLLTLRITSYEILPTATPIAGIIFLRQGVQIVGRYIVK